MSKKKNNNYSDRYCMFCGRPEEEVSLLLQGMDACICADCIKLADDYLKDFNGSKKSRKESLIFVKPTVFHLSL